MALLAYPAYLTIEAVSAAHPQRGHDRLRNPADWSDFVQGARGPRRTHAAFSKSGGAEAAQKSAYPEVQPKPIMVDLEAVQAYQMSLRIAKELGWRIVDANPPNLRGDGGSHIDATDRSLVFKFSSTT